MTLTEAIQQLKMAVPMKAVTMSEFNDFIEAVNMAIDALAKLAKYEDVEEEPDMDEVLRGLYEAKNHAISEYSKKRILKGMRLIIKLANFDETASKGLIERYWRQKQDLLKYIDEVDGNIDPVSEIRDYVEERL